jgi:hypothetical protein
LRTAAIIASLLGICVIVWGREIVTHVTVLRKNPTSPQCRVETPPPPMCRFLSLGDFPKKDA